MVTEMTPLFPPSFWPKWLRREPPPLRLSAEISTLRDELFALRADQSSMADRLARLSGKVYRGVALGQTVEASEEPIDEPEEGNGAPMAVEKAALYSRAAQLRRR